MTWLLVLILIHTDSTVVENSLGGFTSEQACQSTGQAWAVAVRTRPDQSDVPIFRCVPRRSTAHATGDHP